MNLYIENDKLYKKGLFNNQVIEADSIDRIEVDSGVSTVYLKSGKKLTSQSALNWLFENASFYEKNNVSYDDKTYEGQTNTSRTPPARNSKNV